MRARHIFILLFVLCYILPGNQDHRFKSMVFILFYVERISFHEVLLEDLTEKRACRDVMRISHWVDALPTAPCRSKAKRDAVENSYCSSGVKL